MKKSRSMFGFIGLGVGAFAVVRGLRDAVRKGDKLQLVDSLARGLMVGTSSALLIRKLRGEGSVNKPAESAE